MLVCCFGTQELNQHCLQNVNGIKWDKNGMQYSCITAHFFPFPKGSA